MTAARPGGVLGEGPQTPVPADPRVRDDGAVPAEVARVLVDRARGAASLRDVVAVLGQHRLLVPLVQVRADQLDGSDTEACAGTGTAMAAVSMRGPDGEPVGLAFTGTAALAAWDPSARPLPFPARQVAAAVLAEGGRELVVDPASAHRCRIVGLGLVRLASDSPWPPAWQDPDVRRAVLTVLAPAMADGGLAIRLADPGPGAAADLEVGLRFPALLDPAEAARRAEVVARMLGGSELVAAVLEGALAVVVDPPAVS